MNRQQWGFAKWCDKVVAHIYHTPDRERVRQELMWHLEDAAEALAEQGLSDEEVSEKALEAMGDPRQLGLLLRRVYKPWLSYAGWAAMALTAILAIVLLFSVHGDQLWGIRQEIQHLFRPEVNYENYYEHYAANMYTDENGNTVEIVEPPPLVAEVKPGGEVRCGVYTFQVTNGWITESDDGYELYLVFSFSSPKFWTGPPAAYYFGMETDTGRRESLFEGDTMYYPFEGSNMYYRWPRVSNTAWGEYVFVLPDIEPGTEWVEIFCEKGEGFVLRTYLPEGGDWA